MSNSIKAINLSQEDITALEKILRQRNIGAGTFTRAKILLLKAENHSNEYIADKLDITVPTVRLCLDK